LAGASSYHNTKGGARRASRASWISNISRRFQAKEL
jgi:hypothetical protein